MRRRDLIRTPARLALADPHRPVSPTRLDPTRPVPP
ncbi:hypothetical protein FRAAL4391 [Frankia alni ACN14a]|uniref:Uncharacterized protein n=1 Tax=Frankia alni (strain DSM 45986 / CECT 9034 / ACN14a) TaxID=326424 RepID=Q0RHJ3_FRAAA|nr:hypothetical protein FRAAL4391 [Frankia alni ACN14a]